eukprot:CAMPEP_0179052300 /NCGR_PEP_ID=MMETSP0796-20121207/21687_1 /TAXON_ID=73915 /ORGANISM="Pyrodinium bahamense, Strain pbaha01" /LENGTH=42 /DNA_ID= /DNA_START= /DNA_END= /DNA_ORIENTATION=
MTAVWPAGWAFEACSGGAATRDGADALRSLRGGAALCMPPAL